MTRHYDWWSTRYHANDSHICGHTDQRATFLAQGFLLVFHSIVAFLYIVFKLAAWDRQTEGQVAALCDPQLPPTGGINSRKTAQWVKDWWYTDMTGWVGSSTNSTSSPTISLKHFSQYEYLPSHRHQSICVSNPSDSDSPHHHSLFR